MYYINILNDDKQTIEKIMGLDEDGMIYSVKSLRRLGKNFEVFNYDFQKIEI